MERSFVRLGLAVIGVACSNNLGDAPLGDAPLNGRIDGQAIDAIRGDAQNTDAPPADAAVDAVLAPSWPMGALIAFDGEDTWKLKDLQWTKLQLVTAQSPRPRLGYSSGLVYDRARARVILFGGSFGPRLNDTYEFDGTAWSEIIVAAPPPARHYLGMAYDPVRARTVMLGGRNSENLAYQDTWLYDGANWSEQPNANAPPWTNLIAWDDDRRLVVAPRNYENTMRYTYDGTSWSSMANTPRPPQPSYFALAYDPGRHAVVLFGGYTSAEVNTTWLFDGTTWTHLLTATAPSPRASAAMAYDGVSQSLILAAGMLNAVEGTNFSNETWQLQGDNWVLLPQAIGPAGPIGMVATDFP